MILRLEWFRSPSTPGTPRLVSLLTVKVWQGSRELPGCQSCSRAGVLAQLFPRLTHMVATEVQHPKTASYHVCCELGDRHDLGTFLCQGFVWRGQTVHVWTWLETEVGQGDLWNALDPGGWLLLQDNSAILAPFLPHLFYGEQEWGIAHTISIFFMYLDV